MKNYKDQFKERFQEVRDAMLFSIENQFYKANTQLPSNKELSDQYLVNELIIEKVIDSLITDGYLIKIDDHYYTLDYKFQETLTNKGLLLNLNSKDTENQLVFSEINKYIRKAHNHYATVLNIEPDDQIYYVERLVTRNDKPLWYEENYCPVHLLPNLSHIDTTVYSMENILTFNNVPIGGQQQIVDMVHGSSRQRRILDISNEIELLRLSILVLDLYGNNQFFIKRYYTPEKISFNLLLPS